MSEIGKKFDNGKVPYELVYWPALEKTTSVLEIGRNKYGADNWKSLANAEDRYFAAAMRHLLAWRQGEAVDPETGISHLAHLACNVMFLQYFEDQK